jgi:hypothetical protein
MFIFNIQYYFLDWHNLLGVNKNIENNLEFENGILISHAEKKLLFFLLLFRI